MKMNLLLTLREIFSTRDQKMRLASRLAFCLMMLTSLQSFADGLSDAADAPLVKKGQEMKINGEGKLNNPVSFQIPTAELVSIVQQNVVEGIVTDADGEPIVGVTVRIKGTTQGTITDLEGKFSISANKEDILVFSFVGMETREITVGDQTQISVTMAEDVLGLDEVVVVGYGVQKKANLTGAVATVHSEEIVKRPVNHGASLLQGRVAGLNIIQNSGQPGDEGIDFKLRGISSFKNTNPVVLIDGVEGNISAVNPHDIENMTVLKDAASAAIYGARAASGVILITTKKGLKDDVQFEFSANTGFQYATKLPDFIYNSAEYMKMFNKGAEHVSGPNFYTEDMIYAFEYAAPGDPRYPNFDWQDYMFNRGSVQDYQLSVRGGGKNNSYFINMGYMDQEGIIEKYGLKKYSGRMNLDIDVNKSLSIGMKSGLVYQFIEEPTCESIYEMMLYINTMPPTMAPYTVDGTGHLSMRDIVPEIWRNRNPQMILDNPGFNNRDRYEISPQAYIDIHPFEGFHWKTTAAWRYDRTEFEHMNVQMPGYSFATNEYREPFEPNQIGIEHSDSRSSNLTFNSVITYNKTIADKHNIEIIGGYEQFEMNFDWYRIYRKEYTDDFTTDINAGVPEDQEINGNTSSWALQSYFGRATYNYKEKYLLEGNIRYDGASKLAPDYRWDIFPSVSAAWRLSEEEFIKNLGWIDNLKFRLSIGQLGNQSVLIDYPYQELLDNTVYPINSILLPGVSNNKLSNYELTWEVVTTYNLGLDYSMLNGLFGFEVDIYKRMVEGGHVLAQLPASVGKNPPDENYLNMENIGLELALKHAKKIGEFSYNASFLFDTYKNKITKIKKNDWGTYSMVEGHAWREYYMLDWIGIYQNQDEVDNLPIYEPFRAQTQPGDLIFRDVNGNDSIDYGAGGPGDDRVFIEGYHPKFSYSFNLEVTWKNFDLSMFWQGVAGKKSQQGWIGYEPFMQGGPVTTRWRDAWDGEGSTNSLPALYNLSNTYAYNPITGLANDFDLYNTSYLRLKNLQIGYTIPASISEKIRIDKLRLYLTGDNLITITEYNWDPERGSRQGTANTYPQVKTYAFGARITF